MADGGERYITITLPRSHWRQIESDIENMCGTGDHSQIEILSKVRILHDDKPEADPMPVFTIKAKDLLADDTLRAYYDLCAKNGLAEQAAEVLAARAEMREWQVRNVLLLKLPDHKHVPVGGQPGGRG
jgi:hypothetical protein